MINAALDPLHELVVLSQPFSKAAAEVSTSKSDPMDFDNEIAEGIAHLGISPNFFQKVNFSSVARCYTRTAYLTGIFGDYYVRQCE